MTDAKVLPASVSVLVVGMGPTGLAAAAELLRQGITDVLIIDSLLEPNKQTKGSVLAPRSLELLSMYAGVTQDLLHRAIHLEDAKVFTAPGNAIADFKIAGHGGSSFKFFTACEQWWTEECLTRFIKADGTGRVTFARGLKLTALDNASTSDSVTVTLVDTAGKSTDVTAKYLIGADGSRSAVRKALRLDFEGETFPQGFLSVHFDAEPATTLVPKTLVMCAYPNGMGFVTAMPDGSWLSAMDLSEEMEEPYLSNEVDAHGNRKQLEIDHKAAEEIMKQKLSPDIKMGKVRWISHYRVNERLSTRYWNGGRVFLAGDACHCHSPLGGQGMNTGIQDAINISWKIAFVLKGLACDGLLSTYEEERRAIGKSLVTLTSQGQKNLSNTNPYFQFFRNNAVQFLTSFKPIVATVSELLSDNYVNYRATTLSVEHWAHPRVIPYGFRRRAQNILRMFKTRVCAGDRARTDLLAAVDAHFYSRTPGFKLIIFQGLPYFSDPAVERSIEQLQEIVIAVRGSHPGLVTDSVIIKEREDHLAFGVRGQCAFLVRPDGYVGFRCEPVDPDMLIRYLQSRVDTKNMLLKGAVAKFEPVKSDWAPYVFIPAIVAAYAIVGTYLIRRFTQ